MGDLFIGYTDPEPPQNADATTVVESQPMSNPEQCWRFPPFKSSNLRNSGSARDTINTFEPGSESVAISDWQADPFDAHSVARSRPAVYMKRFMMKYVEIILALGDEYFRQSSLDTVRLALQRYIQASYIFGKAPRTLPSAVKPVTKSYNDLIPMNAFSDSAVDMELTFPYYIKSKNEAADPKGTIKKASGVLSLVRNPYFSVPANPLFAALRDLIDDRLFKIRNGLDINGIPRKLALFDPPLDPGMLVRLQASGGVAGFASSTDGPMPNYRFAYMLQKAFEFCAKLKSHADAFLSIKERRDSEKLAARRAKQDFALQSILMEMKQLPKQDALKSIEILEFHRIYSKTRGILLTVRVGHKTFSYDEVEILSRIDR